MKASSGPTRALALVLLAVSLAGCSVRLVASYDEQIDVAATRLQKDMDRFLTRLETGVGSPENAYEANREFYVDYGVELRSVRTRAQAHEKNELTVQQLDFMAASLGELQAAHEDGPIAPEAARVFRSLFNQAWTAVITWEVAKKRGDD